MHGLKSDSCRFWQRIDLPPGSIKFRMVYANAAGLMHGLKYGSCRFWQRNDLTPGSNKFRMVYESAAGRIYGLKCGSGRFWQRTDLPPGSNMLRLAYADSGSACKLAGVQIIPLPTLANQILARTFFRSVANLFASPAVGKFSRASSAGGRLNLQIKLRKPDRFGRRGLSEPREDFSRLPTYAFPCLDSVADSVTCAMRAIASATLQAKHHRSSRTTAA